MPDNDYGDGFYSEPFQKPQTSRQPPQNKNRIPVVPPKKKKSFFGKLFRFILIVAALILIVTGIFMIVVLSRIHYTGEYTDHELSLSEGIELKSENNIENILLFGEDNHKDGERGRADAIILLTIDKKHGLLKQTSFMRDLYVMIPGYGYNKLNAAYVFGGAKLSAETIEYNFGVKIDNYLIVDFASFTEMIDALGGIEIELTYEEIEYINWQSYRNHQTETETEIDPDSFTYSENNNGEEVAPVHLNGRQALWYARDRDSYGSDFDRTKRQRIVINTLVDQLKHSDPIHLMTAVYAVSGYLTTNMDSLTLCGKGIDLLMALGNRKAEHRLPTGDNYYDVWNESGQALQIEDPDLENERLHRFVFEELPQEDDE